MIAHIHRNDTLSIRVEKYTQPTQILHCHLDNEQC